MKEREVEQRGARVETLLERGIPTKEVNVAARREKLGNAKPPISELHYWWTRK
ncbi:MAG: DUF1156 domain-containing protein, partial [Conexivisphaera sp.]